VLKLWEPWVFRKPGENVMHPGREIAKTHLVNVPGY